MFQRIYLKEIQFKLGVQHGTNIETTLNTMQFILETNINNSKWGNKGRVMIDKHVFKEIISNIYNTEMEIEENKTIITHFQSRMNSLIENEIKISEDIVDIDIEMTSDLNVPITNPDISLQVQRYDHIASNHFNCTPDAEFMI